ncbi:transposase [Halomonas sp. TRM85114]|uniref:IS66-like element accessory protein TnpA n=1 Tax=Halomonas jincaotanensis TaxID=2810616 RepID=UPI001BD54513|nr:transposase [Halomonas jincaotanensis]MBS9405729.1 transposase [Halomonas jincaotanensis]
MTDLSVLDAPRKRRRFTTAFKTRIVEACQQPGASVAGIALKHRLNANLVHKWIRTARQRDTMTETPAFVPVPLASAPPSATPSSHTTEPIRLTIPRPNGRVVVEWPAAAADACRRLIRELLA